MKSITINSLAELPHVAEELLKFANDQKFFIFEGDMAAGKTTFIKSLCEALGVEDVVSSPTFSIVNEYDSAKGAVYHFDFYRLKNLQEAYDIGYEEYFYSGNYCLIEWPSKVAELLPEEYVKVEISVNGNEQRIFQFTKIEV
ncbi:tRNA (adenosine(37)-N6)-threonylcarbamoyltransferase complex ATPase subunit type 1 TsaE [Pedobacter sp. SL55]|uniref:tRNA (adenosine(37)-N6)-threonylcarbamoyltransferase complex ATPase subunit type 1 TsaE n=1 Tax=Pedobacter sp. SL55 TaxID=2995161 RepID=UPI002271094B|nr:tRNA (adenosine(37)-N6)-threonylcarbamoyltransferase complex ATPase subunit type 1 TsaE [Pedobacter sp. SL55]WAC41819.1 tRNA (adenosine(37)-N6)-threonylcarbamoyltransferase complex ATPase subunit type 1 TsaE [Pedobacter sp. SL55]